MPVDFDPISRDEQPEENLPSPVPHRRRWVIAASAAVAVALVGGTIALLQSTASASTSTSSALAAAASSSAPPSPHGTNAPGGPRPRGPVKPFLLGTVKSVSGTHILITDLQGFTRTIITSSKTVYKNGLTASPKVGTKIEAEGTVDKDGTSLDATLVQSFGAGFGGFGGLGGKHPGGGFGGGPRPAGTPGVRPTGQPTGPRPTGIPYRHFPGGGAPTMNGTPAININS